MEQKAKLDSVQEISSLYDAEQFNLKGSCTADGSRGSTATGNVCTYDVRTIRTEPHLDRLTDEVDQIKRAVTGVCRTAEKGRDCSK